MQNFADMVDGQDAYRLRIVNRVSGHTIAQKVFGSRDEADAFAGEQTSIWKPSHAIILPGTMKMVFHRRPSGQMESNRRLDFTYA